jgi:hypothetical protein
MAKPKGRKRQTELFARSMKPVIVLEENHRLVQMTEQLDWDELEAVVQEIRRSKLKNEAGRPPQLRALIGAVVFRSTRHMSYRETEEQIRHYGPARYLCALSESEWTPDANTIQDFEELLGEDGMKRLNEYTVKLAVKEGLANPRVIVADTTAQEATIPHPNEMGLMATFLCAIAAASQKAGGALKAFAQKAADKFRAAKKRLREYRLFAKDKSKEAKNKLVAQMASLTESVNQELAAALKSAEITKNRLKGYGKVAHAKASRLCQTMAKLIPQIRYWLKTGHVAADKIINIHIPELYSIVRGKIGKTVEFGLQWGITRLKGGFLLATVGKNRRDVVDARYAVRAVDDAISLFGKAPQAYAYDRGGFSAENVAALKQRGVKHVGLHPRGRSAWSVKGTVKDQLVNERAQVEAGIGTIKCPKYGFNHPAARSAHMMGVSGQRAVLGFNLNKLIRQLASRQELELVG